MYFNVTMIVTQLNSVAFAKKNYDQINDISSFVTDEVQNDTKQEQNDLIENNSIDLELGVYSIEIQEECYTIILINDIKIDNSSKRVKVGTSDNKIVLSDNGMPNDESDDIVEYYPGVFLAEDVNADNTITKEDYELVKAEIKDKSNDLKYDINRDSKIDITDLTYIHKNIDKENKFKQCI